MSCREQFWIILVLWILSFSLLDAQFDPDFTLKSVWGRLEVSEFSLLACYSDENYEHITFSRPMDTGQGTKLSRSNYIKNPMYNSSSLYIASEDALSSFGVFQCEEVKQNISVAVTTLKLPPFSLVELDALSPYKVASLGDDVTLEVSVAKKLAIPIKWRHNGHVLSDSTDVTKIQLTSVQASDAGIYECYYEGRRSEGVHALMRLIIRSCPVDFYGRDCDKRCPACYNGGECHDKWGVCVCPAGFIGSNCEIACGANRIGADCSKECIRWTDFYDDGACSGYLFCKPDPYGCACAPGFKGSHCDEVCEEGWYGADCKQTCHCANGSSCNRITGACQQGCATGWKGNSCQIEGNKPKK